MKKTLALLLCLTLFIGAFPASAFAGTDLKPAYDKLAALDNAYAQLAVAVAYRNAFDGFMDMCDFFSGSENGAASYNAYLSAVFGFTQSAVYDIGVVKSSGKGLSYEDVFDMVGRYVGINCELVGEGVLEDTAYEADRIENEAAAALEKLEAQIRDDSAAAIMAMTPAALPAL